MKDINLTIKQDITVPFLPTARHKNERYKTEVVELNVKIKDISNESFPVAFRVTDFASYIENITYDKYKKLTEDEKKQNRKHGPLTNELRFFNGNIYSPVHVNLHGTLNSTLIETGVTRVKECLNWSKNFYNNYDEKEFNKDKSIIDFETRTKNINREREHLISYADNFVLYNNQLYKKIGEPFYTTGFLGVKPYVSIEYASDSYIKNQTLDNLRNGKISKWDFSAFHKENIYQYLNIDKSYINSYINIEVLMPEICRFKDFIDLENEKKENLTITEFLKDKNVGDKDIKIVKSPEDANKLFKFFVSLFYKTQDEPKDYFAAAKKTLSVFPEENKNLLSQYFEKNNIKTKETFENYLKQEQPSLKKTKLSNFEYTREV